MLSDAELLQRYVTHHDDQAFTTLVHRHLGLVYSAAWRRSAGRAQVAEDVTQHVFCDLARKARFLQHHPALTAWLHRSTRYLAIDAVRAEQRRQKLNETFTLMEEQSPQERVLDLGSLRPLIDAALDELKEGDREVVLLRYFGELTFPEIAQRLQLSESAVRMRAERALDKLRLKLHRRGVVSTSTALGLVLADQMLAAPAPVGLAVSAITASLALPPATGAAALITFLTMNKIIVPVLSAVLAAGLTTVAWTSVTPPISEAELTQLRDQHAELTAAAAPGADPALAEKFVANRERQLGATTEAVEKQIAARRSSAADPRSMWE